MNEERFVAARDSLDRFYTLKNQLKKKITSWNIWSNSDQLTLTTIKKELLNALVVLLKFCDTEHANPENKQSTLIVDIKKNLMNILNFKNADYLSYSDFQSLESIFSELSRYISTHISTVFDHSQQKDIDTSAIVAVTTHEKSDKVLDEDVSLDADNHLPVSFLWKKTNYLDQLTIDLQNVLDILAIPQKVTELNYKHILEKHRDYIFSYNKNKKLHNMINARIRSYKKHASSSHRRYRRWEALIIIQWFLKQKKEKKISGFELYTQAEAKKKEKEQALIRNQSVHFPKIVRLLQQFKKTFKDEYFSKSAQEVREAFVEQYTTLVLDPIAEINSTYISLSEKEERMLPHTDRKKELYQGIPSLIRTGSNELIEKGISNWFIFGEIDALIKFMQKTHKEHKIS